MGYKGPQMGYPPIIIANIASKTPYPPAALHMDLPAPSLMEITKHPILLP